MKIDPNDESTLPPLGECVVLVLDNGTTCQGGRTANNMPWQWCRGLGLPEWSVYFQQWVVRHCKILESTPVSWHSLRG